MAQAEQGDMVNIHYTGTLVDGSVFDSSVERDPLQFTLGDGQVIPGFEEAVLGMEPGDSKKVQIVAEQAYGPHDQEKIIEVSKSQMPSGMPFEVGTMVQGSQPNGATVQFTVTSIADDLVTLDGNHPLAGKDLTFEIQLVSIG